MKKLSLVFVLMIFVLIMTGCSNSMLENSETGKLGPAWDTTMRLPIVESNNNFGALVGASKFQDFDLEINNGSAEFTIKGTSSNPIEFERETKLPAIKLNSDNNFTFESQFVLEAETSKTDNLSIPFPFNNITFADNAPGSNELSIVTENIGTNSIDDFSLLVYDGNNDQLLFKKDYKLNLNESVTGIIDFDGKKIDYNNLNLEIYYDQTGSSEDSAVQISISGLNELKIVKAENISANFSDANDKIDLNYDINLANLGEVSAPAGTDKAEMSIEFITPDFDNFNFDFTSVQLEDSDGNIQSFEEKNGKFEYKSSTIQFGQLEVTSDLKVNDDFSYDANKTIGIKTEIIGDKTFNTNDLDLDTDFEIQDNNLVYKTKPLKIEITKAQIDNINSYILSQESYLKTEVLNSLPLGIQGDIYFGTSKNNLYDQGTKINDKSAIKIEGSEDGSENSTENKFYLDEEGKGLLTKIEEAVEEGNDMFIGFVFKLGDKDQNVFSFSDDQIIKTKAHLGITVKVNQ